MESALFTNEHILAWLKYFGDNANLDLAKVKILDITRKNKNLIPTVISNKSVLVFTDAGHPEIFYDMWDADLGDCDIWYNEGSDPHGPIKHDKLQDMIDRGINASAAMLIINPNAKPGYNHSISGERLSGNSLRHIGSEVRSIIMSKLRIDSQDTICVSGSAGIAIDSAVIAGEGSVIAIEYDRKGHEIAEELVAKFGLSNVSIVSQMDDNILEKFPVPSLAFLVASKHLNDEIKCLLKRNPKMRIIIYALDFHTVSHLPQIFRDNDMHISEMIQISISKLNSKNIFEVQPAPWLVSAEAK